VKILLVVVVAGLAFWFLGSRIVDRGQELSAVANSTESRLGQVADVLREATARFQGTGPAPAGKAWASRVNAVCSRQSDALRRLGTPTTVDEISAYVRKASPIVRRYQKKLASLRPPDVLAAQAGRAGAALERQRVLLADVAAAAGRGDTTAVLGRIEKLRALARRANPTIIGLGLTECALPSPGLPL
jgi:hypothetical protein